MKSKIKHIEHRVYIAIVGVVFAALTVIFLFFPRPKFSGLERRSTDKFPQWEELSENPQQFTADVSHWFSDTEPFRENFLLGSMRLRDALKLTSYIYIYSDSEPISFKTNTADSQSAGIIVAGTGENTRALLLFNAPNQQSDPFIKLVNDYCDAFPGVQIYTLIAPRSSEFYTPTAVGDKYMSQTGMLSYMRDRLRPEVKFVDAYGALAKHTNEKIYLRTDHHWSPLGAYYAAAEFARTAEVPFNDLSDYTAHTSTGFLGSMFGKTKDISLWDNPEEFTYYTPNGTNYTATFVTYSQEVHKDKPYPRRVDGPTEGDFFKEQNRFMKYCVFMGGDHFLVKVQTDTPGSRRLLIIKDSYGNAIPGYLFKSFNQVHIVDYRRFDINMKEYVSDNGITDILFAFNIVAVYDPGASEKVRTFLTQESAPEANL